MATLVSIRSLGVRFSFRHAQGLSVAVQSRYVQEKNFSSTPRCEAEKSYKLLVVGGGAAGSSIAHTFSAKLGKGHVAVLEPSTVHYYQPFWTLVGAGLRKFDSSWKNQISILPKTSDWIVDKAKHFSPEHNTVQTEKGDTIKYDYMLLAVGVNPVFDGIDGLPDALQNDPRVCSNYDPNFVQKTYPALEKFTGGNAIFTFPNSPIKCAGAPQKIAYLADDYFRRTGKRDSANIMYNTSLPVIFGIPRYASVLKPLCEKRNISVNLRHNLSSVDWKNSEAKFELLDDPGKYINFKYDFLHVGPPCSPPEPLKSSSLADKTGYADVDPYTLQHKKYDNIFGMGDCTNAPTAKTAAAVASQSGIVCKNMKLVMDGKPITDTPRYDGYTSCPLMVSKDKCILAEFGYDGSILETFPWDQRKESFIAGIVKKYILREMYFWLAVKGLWHGPKFFRNISNLVAPSKT